METYFTKDHEWVEVEEGRASAGITDYAAGQLGDITYVQLPEVGSEFKKGDILCEIESVKAASEVFAPLSGKVIEVNKDLETSPEMVNTSPQKEGWIAKMEISSPSETSSLMGPKEYKKYLAEIE